jgi:soluble lytic murein transglycosylase
MKPFRLLFALWLAASLLGCSLAPSISANPFGPTRTPEPTQTPLPTATSTPTPTPVPAQRVVGGDRALFNGDFDSARAQYHLASDQADSPDVRAESLWGLARTEYAARNYPGTLDYLNQLIVAYPESTRAAQAHFLMAETYYAQNRTLDAANEYGLYLAQRPGVLDAYALEYQGNAYFDSGNYVAALNSYTTATLAPRLDAGAELQIKIGQTHAALGQFGNAIGFYDAATQQTSNDYIKAQLDYLAGSAYLAIGQTDNAYTRFMHAVQNYPLSVYAYNSLVELVNANVQVSDLDRGLVDYFAAQQGATGYDVGLAALDRYIAAGLDTDGAALYYRALSLEALGRDTEALDTYSNFISSSQGNIHWADAWSNKSDLQQSLGDLVAASQTLRDFTAVAPTNPQADQFLMSAARLLEMDDRLEDAASIWEQFMDRYPGSPLATDAMLLAGISHYRLGNYVKAQADFQHSLTLATDVEKQARAWLWIGKSQQKQGLTADASKSWEQGQALDPTGYYSERARDLLLGRAPFAVAPIVKLDTDLAAERAAAASWLRVTFGLPPETDLTGPGPLASDPRFVRGAELWELGMYDEARVEFEALRQALSTDPANTFRLANYLIDIGLYRPGIAAAQRVLKLAGTNQPLNAPLYFNHLIFGLYFRDLIEPAAQQNGLDPLLLFSVVWQESQFEPFAGSTAGAVGLMQFTSDTGSDMALKMGWPPNYSAEMLYRPDVSVQLGAYFLAFLRDRWDGDLYSALAGYNAGPYGDAINWHDLAYGDPDLFLEVIRYSETRDYIRGVYEIYNIYRTLYSPVQ